MNKLIQSLVLLFSFAFLLKNEAKAQSVVVTINYGTFTGQCCSGNTIPYTCFNDPVTCGAPCGCNTPTNSQNFTNPIPAGNIVTGVDISYFALNCGGSVSASINGSNVGSSPIINGSCLCSSLGSGATGSSTGTFPCGLAGYNNAAGATETFLSTFTGEVCISTAQLTLYYAPANQAVVAANPSTPSGPASVCSGVGNTYSIPPVANATGYTWSISPAGAGTINSGQGSTSVNASFTSAGSICVQASNLCGPSAASPCLAVTLATPSSAPASISATTNPICPGNPTTLSVVGGSLGIGATWTWYAGSCNSAVIGTGTSITVSPASATTYFVNAVGTCNTTACANLLINVNGVQPTPSIPSGTAGVCSGSTQVYTTTGAGGYNWTVPAGTTINSGQGTTSINVTIGSTAGNICVTSTGACGTSPAACTPITITSTPATPGAITGPTPVCPGSDNYSIGAVAGATSYNWSVNGGGSVTAGGTSTAATINWTTAGSWIVSVTANNACGNSTQATFPVTVNPNPNITITPSTTATCSGSVVTMTASGAGGGSYSWSPDASITSGLTNAAISAIPTISPTNYNVTGTDGNGCIGTATQAITVNPTPTVTVAGGGSNSQTVCSGGAVVAINFNITPAGTINWTSTNAGGIGLVPSSGTTNPIAGYTAPSVVTQQTGVITVNATSASGCASTGSTDLTYTITVNPLPGATAPSYTPASCGVSNGVATITGTGGSGTYQYSWNSGAFGAGNSFTDSAGTYPVSIKDAVSGCVFTTNVSIPNAGAPPPPMVTATTMTVCAGGSTTLFAPPVAGITYSWTPVSAPGSGATGNSYTVTNITLPSYYLVTVTSSSMGCTGTAGTVSITVNPLPPTPTFSLPTTANNTSCQGSPPTLTVNSGTSTAVWYSNNIFLQTGSSYTPPTALPAGTYTFSIIDSIPAVNGCINAPQSANTVTLSLVVNPSPTAPNPISSTLTTECQNEVPATTLSVTPTGTLTSVPVWYNGTTYLTTGNTYTPPDGTSGTTVYTVIDSSTVLPNTCTSAATGSVLTLSVVVNAAPGPPVLTAPTGTNNTYCQGSPTALTVTTATTSPSPVAVWYSNNVQVFVGSSYTPPVGLAPGTYTYSVIDSLIAGGCISASQLANTVTLSLTVMPSPPPPVLTNSVNAITECQYLSPAGTFTVTSSANTVPVWYITSPTTGTVAIGVNTYTPPDVTTGTFNYIVIDSSLINGCTSASTGSFVPVSVTVNLTPSTPTLTAASNLITECQGATPVTLNVIPAVGSTPVWYNTSTGVVVATGSTYTPPNTVPSPPSIIYNVIDSATTLPATGCTSLLTGNTLTVSVTVHPAPTINVTNQTTLDSANCGKAGTLTVSPSAITGLGTPPLHYQWLANGSPILNDTTLILTTNTSSVTGTTYSLQISDANGCFAIAAPGTGTTFTVPSVASPVISFSTSPNPATGNIPLTVTFTNQTTGANTYTWTFGDGNGTNSVSPSNTYTAVGTYTVMLIASNGSCKDTATAIVITDEPTMIIIPNVFSPNGDNINDQFFIINTGMTSLNCNIFNRWGQLLFTITAPNQSWDGKTPTGDNAPDGTYMYILQAQGLNGKAYKQQGTITLIR